MNRGYLKVYSERLAAPKHRSVSVPYALVGVLLQQAN